MTLPFCIGITPFDAPDETLAAALARAGALGVLDLGRDPARAGAALARLARLTRRFGVRIPDGVDVNLATLPAGAETIIVMAGTAIARFKPRRVVVQVSNLSQARAALEAGADALIAKGNE